MGCSQALPGQLRLRRWAVPGVTYKGPEVSSVPLALHSQCQKGQGTQNESRNSPQLLGAASTCLPLEPAAGRTPPSVVGSCSPGSQGSSRGIGRWGLGQEPCDLLASL